MTQMSIRARSMARKAFLTGTAPRPSLRAAHTRVKRLDWPVRALLVRPYTTRKGDTIHTIAEKRGFAVDELIKLNHQTDVHVLEEGTTLLLPAEKLSKRDSEILAGIGSNYRTYPVRQGESIADIVTKRGITMEELVELNPDIDLQGAQANTVLKLPVGKYTTREKEMLIGVSKVPVEFFQSKGFIASSSVMGVAVLMSIYLWWRSGRNRKD